MKVRYWNSQKIMTVPSPKELVNQIKLSGTKAMSLPNGDIPINYAVFLMGGRASIDQLLSVSNKSFYGHQLTAMYVRHNAGLGKHYTIVAVKAQTAGTIFADSRIWTDLNVVPRPVSPRGQMNYNSVATSSHSRSVTSISCAALANALSSAEAKVTGDFIAVSGI